VKREPQTVIVEFYFTRKRDAQAFADSLPRADFIAVGVEPRERDHYGARPRGAKVRAWPRRWPL
jgi:hypothetical protein